MSMIGDNTGALTDAQKIAANLAEKHADIVRRSKEIVAGLPNVPEVIATQEESDRVSEFVRACTAFDKAADGTRIEEKEPYLSAERAVDGFFNVLRDPVKKVKATLLQRATAWDIKVERAERERRETAAQQAAEEAAMLAAQAKSQEEMAEVFVAKQVAQDAIEAAQVKPAELTRTRTSSGVTRSLRREWRGRVINENKVPRRFFVLDESLIQAEIKAKTQPDGTCTASIPGIELYEHFASTVR